MRRLGLVAALFLGGCASFSTMTTARTVAPDTNQLWIAPEFAGMTIDSGNPPERDTISVPQFELGFRRGITDGVELGGKLWLLGMALQSKFQVVRSAAEDSGIDVAIAPSIGWLGVNSSGSNFNVVTGYLDVPIGINVYGGSQLVLTPKAVYQRYMARDSGSSGSFDLLFLGGSVGYAWKLGTTRILPEISMLQPIINPSSGSDLRYNGVVFQGGLGFLFGG